MGLGDRMLHLVVRTDFLRAAYAACRRAPIFGACLHRVALKLFPPGTHVWIRIPQGAGRGLWFYADLRFEPGYYNGDHEPWLQEFLEESLDEGDCFYDIGAHTGFFALIAARLVGDRGLVLALEPDPRNAEVLRANLERNHMHQVKLMEAAAWSSSGKVTFQQDYDASNRTQGHITLGAAADSREITVPAVSLDELVFGGGQRPPDLIKMDVEGAEGEALQGVARTLREVKPTLLCEVHNPAMLDQCRAFLGECGYSVESWAPVHPHCPDCRQHYLKACVSP